MDFFQEKRATCIYLTWSDTDVNIGAACNAPFVMHVKKEHISPCYVNGQSRKLDDNDRIFSEVHIGAVLSRGQKITRNERFQ